MRNLILVVTLVALPGAAQAEPRSSWAEPRPIYSKGGNYCPSGYVGSGDYCRPTSPSSRPAFERPPGAFCPSGYQSSGAACVKN